MAPRRNRRMVRARTTAADSMSAAAPDEVRAAIQIRIPGSPGSRASLKLRVRLARDPSPTAASVDDLVVGGTLTLPIELVAAGEAGAPARQETYFRSIHFALTSGDLTLASAESKGRRPAALLAASLDRATTLAAIRALAGRPTSLEVRATSRDIRTPMAPPSVPLADLMRDLDEAGDHEGALDPWVVLTAPDPVRGEYRPIPIRMSGAHRGDQIGRPVLTPSDHGFESISARAAVSSISAAPASAIAIHPSLPLISQIHHGVFASDIQIALPDLRPRLPRVDDPLANVWPDTVDPSSYWYLPDFRVLQPEPGRPASESPFVYRFEESGHDIEGRPGLNATITFTLRQEPGDAVARRLVELGNPRARPVPFENLAVSLSIPFRDAKGETRREIVTASTVRTGDVLVSTVSLLDNWARLAYGALAFEGFQSEPPSLRVDMYFRAMMRILRFDWLPILSKYHVLPLTLAPRRDLNGDVTLATASGTVQFAREPVRPPRTARPLSLIPLSDVQPVAVHGRLHSQVLQALDNEAPTYAQRTAMRSRELTSLFPCETLGAFYLQTTDEGDVAVGCRDALKLGQSDYRLYAPVEDGRIPEGMRVFRSLVQPGRFLIAPMAYKVARFAENAGDRAFRPAIFLYASIDPSKPENNHAALLATLGPGLQAHDLERARDLLRELSPAPTLQLLTEIAADVSYVWSLADGKVVKDRGVVRRWDSFQASMTVDLEQVPIFESMLGTSGVAIVATFTLPDGSKIDTTLDLNLNEVVGPIGRTPLDVKRVSGGASLVNRVERDVDVDDLLAIDDDAAPGRSAIIGIPVERTLAPGESVTIQAELPPDARLIPVATPKSGAMTLAEIRSFVEDIHTQVAFINLVNFGNRDLESIAVEVRIQELPETYRTTLGPTDSVQVVEMILPLTRYLSHPVLQFQVSITRRDGSVQQTSWIDWPLETKGNVIGITWELLGLPG